MALSADARAHDRAVRAGTATIASSLRALVGQRVTATIVGVRDAKAVGKWTSGERTPHPNAERRLREAVRVADLLLQEESPAVVRAWFVGLNPELDDRVPALVLAEEPAEVLRAARSFLANG